MHFMYIEPYSQMPQVVPCKDGKSLKQYGYASYASHHGSLATYMINGMKMMRLSISHVDTPFTK